MPGWMNIPWQQVLRVLLEGCALFIVATIVFDVIHFTLHQCLNSRWRWLRLLASPHQAHHDFCDRQLVYHDAQVARNLVMHVMPEYGTQMVVCSMALLVLDLVPVLIVIGIFTTLFVWVIIMRGRDPHHVSFASVPAARDRLLVNAPYHALHHRYPDSYMSSYVTLFDNLMGTACQIKGRRFAITGSSGSFGSAMKELLERAGAQVMPLSFGIDFTYEDYSGADSVLKAADILVLAHGAKGEHAMQANCDSFLALIERFRSLTRDRQFPVEVWAVGSEIECHPSFGNPELQSYARSKRAYARAAAPLARDKELLYRHIVPSAFRSRMGWGLISGRTAAAVALFLIRRGFRYVPVTYTGIAFLNFLPFVVRGMAGGSARAPRVPRPAAASVDR